MLGRVVNTSTLFIFLLLLLCSFQHAGNAQQLDVQYSRQPDLEEEEVQFRFFDNQRYLRELEERRRSGGNSVRQSSPVIIINNYNYSNGYRRNRQCDSWGVQVRSGDYAFSYRDGYRPNCFRPIIIVPGQYMLRSTPYIYKKSSPHRRDRHK